MPQARRAAIWLAALGLVITAVLALTSTYADDHRSTSPAFAATPHHQVDGDATFSQRHQPVRPAILWWVAAIAALLVVLRPWRRSHERASATPRLTTWAGRYDRGPPTDLITP